MKNPNKSEQQQPKAVEALVVLTETVLQFHGEEKPTLSSVARVTGRASRLLRISDLDERLETENAATIQIAKKHGLMS
jgi:hypothetical protein